MYTRFPVLLLFLSNELETAPPLYHLVAKPSITSVVLRTTIENEWEKLRELSLTIPGSRAKGPRFETGRKHHLLFVRDHVYVY